MHETPGSPLSLLSAKTSPPKHPNAASSRIQPTLLFPANTSVPSRSLQLASRTDDTSCPTPIASKAQLGTVLDLLGYVLQICRSTVKPREEEEVARTGSHGYASLEPSDISFHMSVGHLFLEEMLDIFLLLGLC